MAEPICIIGDSITGGVVYLSDSAKYTHWKDSFVNLLGASLDTEMKNHSKFGCTSGAALKRLERYSKDIAACPNTLVMLGGNDSDFNWPAVAAEPEAPHDCNTPMARFTEYYNKVLDGIQAPAVVVMPVGEHGEVRLPHVYAQARGVLQKQPVRAAVEEELLPAGLYPQAQPVLGPEAGQGAVVHKAADLHSAAPLSG